MSDLTEERKKAVAGIIKSARESASESMEDPLTSDLFKTFLEHPEYVIDSMFVMISRLASVENDISTLKAMLGLLLGEDEE